MSLDILLLDRFLSDLHGRGYAESSLRLRRERLSPAVEWFRSQGVLLASQLSPEEIDRFVGHLITSGLKRWTVKSYASSLRIFGRWLVGQDLVLVDPAADLSIGRGLREEELPPRPLSEQAMESILAAIEVVDAVGLRNRAHVELLYACGLRLGESLALDLTDIDFEVGSVVVKGKGGHGRTLPVLPGALAAVRDYVVLRRELVQGPDCGELFLGRNGARLRAHTFRAWLARLGKRVLGKDTRIFPHLIRHTCAVHMLMRHADIRLIQLLLGHVDLDMTRTYLRLLPDELRAEYERTMPILMASGYDGGEGGTLDVNPLRAFPFHEGYWYHAAHRSDGPYSRTVAQASS